LLASRLRLQPQVPLISRESSIFSPQRDLGLARVIVQEWQAFARQEGRSVIRERTPEHVHSAGRIRRLLPESRIIVVVRNPLDTCASPYSRFHDLGLAIERWLMDSKAALAVMQQESTLLVRHESLTRRPAETLSGACSFLGNMAIAMRR